MSWVVFSLLMSMIGAVDSVMHKFYLEKIVKSWLSYVILLHLVWSLFAFIIFFTHPISFNIFYAVVALVSGIIEGFTTLLYFKALSMEEVSRVVPLDNLATIFVAVLAFFFLGEIFTVSKYVGIMFLVVGATTISLKKNGGKKLFLTPATLFIILECAIYGVSSTLSKFALLSIDFWSFFFWSSAGGLSVTFSTLAWKSVRKNFTELIKMKTKHLTIVFISQMVLFVTTIFWLVAASLGPISLVVAMGTLSPFFVFLYTIILSIFIPKILEEEVSKSIVLVKLFSITLIVTGVWLVAG